MCDKAGHGKIDWTIECLASECDACKIERLEAVVEAALTHHEKCHLDCEIRNHEAALNGEQVRDAACLDAGCDIEGNEPHKPHCENAALNGEQDG
jgi:hypothetical protein